MYNVTCVCQPMYTCTTTHVHRCTPPQRASIITDSTGPTNISHAYTVPMFVELCCYFRGSITSSCLCYMWLFFSVMSYRELAGWTALLPLLGPHHEAIWDQYTQQDPYIVFLNGWAFMWREWFVLIVYWTSVESNLQLQINNTPKTNSVPTLCLLPYEMPWKPTKIESSDPGIRLTSMNSRNQLNILIPDFN